MDVGRKPDRPLEVRDFLVSEQAAEGFHANQRSFERGDVDGLSTQGGGMVERFG
ncbi:hypothetical protein D3C87_2051330 [compost metagenome]